MGDVVQMTTAIKPKMTSHRYHGHSYVLSYKPAKPIGERWEWHVKFTRTYEFAGSCATEERSMKEARAKIDSMIERVERVG